MIEENIDLSKKTTYKFGGFARYYLEYNVNTSQEIFSKVSGITNDIYFLGKGSNVAFSDKGYPGIVIRSTKDNITQISENVLEVYSGTPMPEVARFCKTKGLSGAEFMIGIPGSIGGGIAMNAGAYGSSTADILEKVFTYSFIENKVKIINKNNLNIGYRVVKGIEEQYIDKVHLVLEPGDINNIESKHKEYLQHRKKTQPSGLYNAGSVFKNPEGYHAGQLIEEAGLKGYRRGTVSISKKHANFFVAERKALASDLFDLVNYAKGAVYDLFGVELEEEIRFVGDFG